jgi:hypothetical protein
MQDELRRHQGGVAWVETDAFQQIPLEKTSQAILAFWLPGGLVMPTRLVYGTKNAGVALQKHMNVLRSQIDDKRVRDRTSNYYDDISSSVTDLSHLVPTRRAILRAAIVTGTTLKPSKTRIGFKNTKLLGHMLEGDRITPHEDNLRPLRELRPPQSKPELRRALGLLLLGKDHTARYSVKARPLTKLTGNVPFAWTATHQGVFDSLKEEVLAAPPIHQPDRSRPLHIDSDASDDGWGAVLYQLPREVPDEEFFRVGPDQKRVVKYMSAPRWCLTF